MGYHLAKDMKTCIDEDECTLDRHECNSSQLCMNTVGSFICLNITASVPGESTVCKYIEEIAMNR